MPGSHLHRKLQPRQRGSVMDKKPQGKLEYLSALSFVMGGKASPEMEAKILAKRKAREKAKRKPKAKA